MSVMWCAVGPDVQERARWGAVMEGMNLAPRQQEALLALRKQHLLRLTSIYQDRQHLNMQVTLYGSPMHATYTGIT